jgi:putative membrane protein
MRRRAETLLALLLVPAAAFAHGGEHRELSEAVWSWWSWDPGVLLSLAVSGGLYVAGVRRLWRRAGTGHGVRRWEAAAFAAGWLALIVALISPLDALGGVLFSAHMTQHEVLMLIAAPLMVFGRPGIVCLWALPPAARDRIGRAVRAKPVAAVWSTATSPLVVWTAHGLALWLWHIPALYQATLGNDWIHAFQHLSFFGTAVLFWWSLIHGRYGRIGYGVGVFYVFTTALHSSILGALLTLAPRLWYPIYEERALRWHLSPLEDQQLAGLLMWIPTGVIFVVLGLALFAAWLGESERRVAHTRSETLARALAGDTGRSAR